MTRYFVAHLAERFFRWLQDWSLRTEWRVAVCPDCGRNRYTGAPCKNTEAEG